MSPDSAGVAAGEGKSVGRDLTTQRIMVTGGAGFLGSFLVERLEAAGCREVFVPRSAEFDLRREPDVRRALAYAGPEIVIHLAAVVGGIGANEDEPGRFFHDNALMGIQLIEQARQAGVEKFVCIGSVCAYPKHTPVPFLEDDLWNGYPEETNAPYGIAKKALLVQLQAYRRQHGFNGIFLLPVNLYGPRDNFDLRTSHVIPAIIRKCIEAKERGDASITLWGTGTVSREFLYVEDAAEAIMLATERYDGAEPVNLGAGFEITVRKLAEKIAELTGFDGKIRWDPAHPDGQPRRSLDTSRAAEEFGFRAVTSLEDGLQATIRWYENVQNRHPSKLQAMFHQPSVEEVNDGGTVIAIVLRGSLRERGVHFYSQPEFPQQIGFFNHPVGHIIPAHVHNAVPRRVIQVQETLFVREGALRVDFYRQDQAWLCSRVLTDGDVVLLANGGHGFEILEKSSIIEVKQGPYIGDCEKTRFEGERS